MKKISLTLCTFCLIHTVVCANSSWHWISQTRPYDVLPVAIVITLLIEMIGIIKVAKTKISKSILVILLGNLASFAAPYLLALNSMYSFKNTLNFTPFYNVGIAYLFITLIVELPVVYNLLEKDCDDKKRLVTVILVTNVITTVITCLLERLLCHGAW